MIQAEKWQKDLAVYQDINTTFIVEGNVHDLQPWIYEDDGTCEPVALSLYLQRYLTEEGYDPEFGARPVKRAIQQFVLNDLSRKILADEVDRSKPIIIDDFGDGLVFRN